MAQYHAVEAASKYSYDSVADQWHRETVWVRIDDEPFAMGKSRACHRMEQVQPALPEQLCAKLFTEKVVPEVYFNHAMSTMLSQSYADEFNLRQGYHKLTFQPLSIYQLRERDKQLIIAEPLLSEWGLGCSQSKMALDALAHFSFEASNFQLIIADAKTIGPCLFTAPVIHSCDRHSFGAKNDGLPGIRKRLDSHTCGDLCKILSLPHVSSKSCEPAGPTQTEQMLQGLQGMSQGSQTAAPSSYAQTQRPDSVSPLRLPTVETETEQICKMLQGVSQGSQMTATAAEPLSYRQKTQRPDSVSPLRLPTVEIQAERRSCSPLRFEVLQNFQLARQKALAAVLTDGPDTSRGDNRTPKYAVMGASARGGEQEGRGRSGKERRQKLSSDILDDPVEFDRGPLPERESRRRHGANEPVAATFSRAQAEGASFAGRSLSPRRPGPLAAIAARARELRDYPDTPI